MKFAFRSLLLVLAFVPAAAATATGGSATAVEDATATEQNHHQRLLKRIFARATEEEKRQLFGVGDLRGKLFDFANWIESLRAEDDEAAEGETDPAADAASNYGTDNYGPGYGNYVSYTLTQAKRYVTNISFYSLSHTQKFVRHYTLISFHFFRGLATTVDTVHVSQSQNVVCFSL
jgi:hypothetical protein